MRQTSGAESPKLSLFFTKTRDFSRFLGFKRKKALQVPPHTHQREIQHVPHQISHSNQRALFLAGISGAANAQVTSTFTGNIDGDEPQAFEVDNAICTVIEPLLHYYEAFQAFVTETGNYDYTDQSIFFDLDMQLTIYTPTYDPNNVLMNCVARFDDSGTFALQAGVQYVFVVQPLFDSSFNTGDWEFNLVGPGQVIEGSAPPPTPTPVPALSFWAILLLTTTILGGSMVVLMRR